MDFQAINNNFKRNLITNKLIKNSVVKFFYQYIIRWIIYGSISFCNAVLHCRSFKSRCLGLIGLEIQITVFQEKNFKTFITPVPVGKKLSKLVVKKYVLQFLQSYSIPLVNNELFVCRFATQETNQTHYTECFQHQEVSTAYTEHR